MPKIIERKVLRCFVTIVEFTTLFIGLGQSQNSCNDIRLILSMGYKFLCLNNSFEVVSQVVIAENR